MALNMDEDIIKGAKRMKMNDLSSDYMAEEQEEIQSSSSGNRGSSSKASSFTPTAPMHPNEVIQQVFSNELIISKIMEHLPFDAALKFRLLSKAWNFESLKKIKANHKMLRLSVSKTTEDASNPNFKLIPLSKMIEFSSTIGSSKCKFSFTRFSFVGSQLCSHQVAGFLKSYGSFITEAEIEWNSTKDGISHLSVFRETLLFLLPSLQILHLKNIPISWFTSTSATSMLPPWLTSVVMANSSSILKNLQEIKIELTPPLCTVGVYASYVLLMNLLQIAPNIVNIPCLEPHLVPADCAVLFPRALDMICKLNKEKQVNILKGLKLTNANATSYLRRIPLFRKGVFLTSMVLSMTLSSPNNTVAYYNDHIKYIEQILSDQKSTLKSLHFEVEATRVVAAGGEALPQFSISFPKLEKLTQMTFVQLSRNYVTPTDTSFSQNLPALKQIEITGGFTEYPSRLEMKKEIENVTERNCTITKLKVNGSIDIFGMLRWATLLFPRVKSLTVDGLDWSLYPFLWDCWPELEEFYIGRVLTENVDSVLTGIPPPVCSKILSELSEADRFTGSGSKLAMWYSNRVGFNSNIAPTITRWKKLRKLYINYLGANVNESLLQEGKQVHSKRSYISDTTGCMAFSKMRNLQELVVGNCMISSYCAKVLESKISYVKISPRIEDAEEDDTED